jgi:hypothetical protein
MTQLRDKALMALDEAATRAVDGEVLPKSEALRFILAFLANFTEERRAFDLFWKAVTSPPIDTTGACTFGRTQTINNTHKVIYRKLGLEPP